MTESAGPFFGVVRGDGEKSVGEHGECYVAVPGGPGADLVVVEPRFVLASSKAFFDRPSGAGHVHESAEPRPVRIVAAVEREFTVGDGPVVSGIGDRVRRTR